MAAGVSIMFVPFLLALQVSQTPTYVAAVAFGAAPSSTVDPYVNYTCPNECMCYKMNETTSKPTTYINCTVARFSSHLTDVINSVSNRLTAYAVFTCAYSQRDFRDDPPDSFLWEGAFQDMTELTTLIFDRCKFRSLPSNAFEGISSLTGLAIRGALIPTPEHNLLDYLPKLEILEVSNSDLSHFIPLCNADSLRILNISGNSLTSLEDTGLHCLEGQLSGLETLDVTNNAITELPHWLGKSLPNLYHLALGNNYIFKSNESPFQDLRKLTLLDLSNNSFTSFTPKFFYGCTNLLALELSGNKVPLLPRDIFTPLPVLNQLNLGDMGLNDQVWRKIVTLRQLTHLNISHNELTTIDSSIIGQFPYLEHCLLGHNKITSFQRGAFDYQDKLVTLDLSYNFIPEIPPDAFRSQYFLKHLMLHDNNISMIGMDAFSALKELLTFDLSHNNISFLPFEAFSGLLKVKSLDLSSNKLTLLKSTLFSSSLQIVFLNLSQNRLTDIPVLNQLLSLQIVDFSFNNLSILKPEFFMELRDLSTVDFSHNNILDLPLRMFQGCASLKYMDLSHNSLRALDESTFKNADRLETINLSYNSITNINKVFSVLKSLSILNLSNNKLTQVVRGWFPTSIQHIDLRNNEISSISVQTFKSLSSVKSVDLSGNRLQSLSLMDFDIDFRMSYSPLFHLQFNPLICDCRLGWLKDWSQGNMKDMKTLPNFPLTGLTCSSPFHKFSQTLQMLSRSEFLCNYTKHCKENCMCCDYDACHCKYICPFACQCFIGDAYFHAHYVVCHSASLTEIPSGLPEGATHLRLDGNDIQTLQRHAFLVLKHVESLYLNSSNIHAIQNSTFRGLKSVKKLYLNDNHLTAIYSVTFEGLDSLSELYLHNNDIYSIESQALIYPPNLSLVNLQGNALTTISLEELWHFTNRTAALGFKSRLYLSGNPWTCDAEFVCKFLQFAQRNSDATEDISYLECFPSGTTEKPVLTHQERGTILLDYPPALCGSNQSTSENITRQSVAMSSSKPETYALVASCVIVIFIIMLIIIAYINRHLLQVLCFTRFGFRMFKKPKAADDNERPYDAFISYSNKDEDFVIRQLAPRLENGDKKFRLCVHYRDFPVGACIAETIVRSVEASKRTILVVSDNFLDSEWCRFEFQTAHQQVLNERRNRVILILMHDLDSEKLDSTLKVYMRTRTYLKYEDPWFWEKLLFAMPDIRHRKPEMPVRLPSCRDLEYTARDKQIMEQQQQQHHHSARHGQRCGTIHNDMYEIPVLDSPSVHYQLANGVCSTHTNTAYHNSDGSDSTSGYHNGSLCESCGHYEEVGPGSSSIQSTPQKQIGTPPPVPSIPKDGFVPRQKLRTLNT